MTQWQPTNQPGSIDETRLDRLKPVQLAIEALGLPSVRFRKLNGLLNALAMQIEDGGDHPDVNELLLAALKVGVRHQVGAEAAQPVLDTLDTFAQAEAERWQKVRAGILPPVTLKPIEQINAFIQAGYALLEIGQNAAACAQWLSAWNLIKPLVTPSLRTIIALSRAQHGLTPTLSDWTLDFMFELHNAGLDEPVYRERRLSYTQEFLTLFPDEDDDHILEFHRAQGEALWALGRAAEGEIVFQALVNRFPNKAWGYIGWSDQYYLFSHGTKQHERAEAILQQALTRKFLDDREAVVERLNTLYQQWRKPEPVVAHPTRASTSIKPGPGQKQTDKQKVKAKKRTKWR
jgi:hypothetical protein